MVELLHGDVVDIEIAARSDSADAVVNALGDGGDGDGVDDDVSSRKVVLYCGRGGGGDLFRALEGEIAGHADGDVGEIAGAGTTGANAVDGEDSINGGELAQRLWVLVAHLSRGGVEKSIEGAACEFGDDEEDDDGDKDGGDGVG
jgi:hypothetical protein